MATYPTEFNIYATVSKVEMPEENSKNRGVLHLFVLDGQKGAAHGSRTSHQGHLLREVMENKWITVGVEDVSTLKKITSGDLISLGVILENTKERRLSVSPSRFGLPIYDKKLNNLVAFVHDVIGNKFSGDKEIKKLFGIFGDELFDYAINNAGEFLEKGKQYGASIASLIRCRDKAESHILANEAFNVLRKASVEVKSASRIVTEYGGNAYNHLEENPWYFCRYPRLLIQYGEDNGRVTNPRGFGGPTESKLPIKVRALDEIYRMLNGVSDDLASNTGRAYWIYSSLLHKGHGDGHTAMTRDELVKEAYESGLYDLEQAEQMLDSIVQFGSFVETEDVNGITLVSDKHDYDTEKEIVDIIERKMKFNNSEVDETKLLFEDFLTKEQRQAVKNSLECKLSVVTGGAGTGKTTVIKSIIKNAISHNHIDPSDIVLLAPTGKAKDRMKESTGYDANTISKLITKHNFSGKSYCDGKFFIIDEAGMQDSKLVLDLFRIIPDDANIVMVGDKNQLAPVKHGQPFKDMLVTKYVSSTKLSKPQRTSSDSEIHQAATLISEGMLPEFARYKKEVTYFPTLNDDVLLAEVIRTLSDDFEEKFKTSLEDTVVLSPMNIGPVGVRNLNQKLKPLMNPKAKGEGLKINGRGPFHEGDRIIINKNDNENDISNGDVGVIEKIGERGEISLALRDKVITLYGKGRNIIEHAFCLTVHKTQGSEYQTVIMAISNGHKRMLTPELFYTGVTRAKKNLVVIGDHDAIGYACDSENKQLRTTFMEAKLKNLAVEKGVYFSDNEKSNESGFSAQDFHFSSKNSDVNNTVGNEYENTTERASNFEAIPIEAYQDDIQADAGDFGRSIDFEQDNEKLEPNSPDANKDSVNPSAFIEGIITEEKSKEDNLNSVMDFDDFQF